MTSPVKGLIDACIYFKCSVSSWRPGHFAWVPLSVSVLTCSTDATVPLSTASPHINALLGQTLTHWCQFEYSTWVKRWITRWTWNLVTMRTGMHSHFTIHGDRGWRVFLTCQTPITALAMRMRRITIGSTKAVVVSSPSSNRASTCMNTQQTEH